MFFIVFAWFLIVFNDFWCVVTCTTARNRRIPTGMCPKCMPWAAPLIDLNNNKHCKTNIFTKFTESHKKSRISGRHMGPALTDRTGIAKNLSHTCIGKQQGDVCAWRRESGRNWAQIQPKYTCPWQLNLHIHTSGKWVFDYKRQDAHKGIDFGHQGGATCKFSGQFTVELVRTKNRTFHHRNLTKSIVLTHVKW